MARQNFIRVKEDFICEVCGAIVKGTGYTNHCPNCLTSKHVDEIVPGDRTSGCLGLMDPMGIEMKKGIYLVIHRCRKCGKTTRNRIQPGDNFDQVISLSRLG